MLLDRIEKLNQSASILLERIAIIALMAMLSITCVDVIGTKCFKSPLLGSIDIVTLCQVIAIAFTITIAQISGRHISVEIFIEMLPKRTQAVIDSVIYFLLFLFFVLIVWRVTMFGLALQRAGEVSETLSIPIYPFIFAISIGFVPMGLLSLLKFLNAMIKTVKR